MSAVTASIIVGSKHRIDPGIQPRWLLMLHEGQSYAWHLLKLQLTNGDLPSTRPDDPPGVLWQASTHQDLMGEMALLLHLFAARTPEVVRAAARTYPLRKQRVDLAALEGRDADDLTTLLELARGRGRELTLAVTILPGSRLTEEALRELPDWELNISHTAVTRDWHSDQQALVVKDLRPEPAPQEAAPELPEDDSYDEQDAGYANEHGDYDDEGYPPADEGFWGLGWSGQASEAERHDADADELVQAVHAQNEAAEKTVGRTRFGRRKHRPTIEVERRISLAEFFGRGD